MIYPLVLDLAADGIPVAVACRVLGFSKQAFFKWRKNPVPQRDWDDAHLTDAAIDAHRDDPGFGYRFIADELREAGLSASERRIWRLCSQQQLWSSFSKKRGLNRKAGPPVHDDRVRRAFTAPDVDKLWLTDITEHQTGEGKLYLCAVKDVCSKRIVGYSIDSRMKASLAVDALKMAVHRRSPVGTVVTRTEAANFDRDASCGRSRTQGCADRWAESVPAPTTPRRSRSSRSCRRTSSTVSDGRHARISVSRS